MDKNQLKQTGEIVKQDIREDVLKTFKDINKSYSNDQRIFLPKIKQGLGLRRLHQEIKRTKNLIVEFKVDKTIKEGLKNKDLIRKGGVIVNKKNHTVVKWLDEVKLTKAGKALNIGTIALDVLSEVALNEKLKQIQAKLETIEGYSEAEHWHSFLDGTAHLKSALRVTGNSDHQKQLLYDARRSFESAKSKNIVLLKKRLEKIDLLYEKYLNTKIDNHKLAQNIFNEIRTVFPILNLVVQCCRAQAKIFESLNDLTNATAMIQEAVQSQADVYDYLYSLAKGGELKKNRKEIWSRYTKMSKKYFWPNWIYKKVAKKELPIESIAPEYYFARWLSRKKFEKFIRTERDLIMEHNRLHDELLFLMFEISDSEKKPLLKE